MTIAFQWVLWFVAYSFMGWVYESIICSIAQKKFINRGFLNGPLCPVYGFGALVCILLLYQRIEDPVALFFMGMLLTCAVEYVTAVLLEKLFQAKWWDYSNRRFNLNGRVCLLGALVFGILSVLLVKIIHPQVAALTAQVPEWLQIVLCGNRGNLLHGGHGLRLGAGHIRFGTFRNEIVCIASKQPILCR